MKPVPPMTSTRTLVSLLFRFSQGGDNPKEDRSRINKPSPGAHDLKRRHDPVLGSAAPASTLGQVKRGRPGVSPEVPSPRYRNYSEMVVVVNVSGFYFLC